MKPRVQRDSRGVEDCLHVDVTWAPSISGLDGCSSSTKKKMFQVGQNIVIQFHPDKFIWEAEKSFRNFALTTWGRLHHQATKF